MRIGNTLKFTALSTLAYVLMIAIYILLIKDSIYSSVLRFPELNLSDSAWDLVMGYILVLLPISWVNFENRTSKVLYIYLYYSVLMPSIIFCVTDIKLDISVRYFNSLYIVFCFFVISSAYLVPLRNFRFSRRFHRNLKFMLVIFTTVSCAYFVIFDRSMFANMDLFDVYEKRLEIREAVDSGLRARANVYLSNWLGIAIAPFLAIVGFRRKQYSLVCIGLLIAYIAFGASSAKIVFFSSVMTLTYVVAAHILSKYYGARNIVLTFAFVLVVFYIGMAFVLDVVFGAHFTWAVTFRLFLNNGYLTAVYLEFFKSMPNLLYADSFMSTFIDWPYGQSYSRMIGDYITKYSSENNANANFVADGYANLGYFGMLFSAVQIAVVIWLIDCASRNKDLLITTSSVIPLCVAFSNVPVHTGIISTGGFLVIILLAWLPVTDQEVRFGRRSR